MAPFDVRGPLMRLASYSAILCFGRELEEVPVQGKKGITWIRFK